MLLNVCRNFRIKFHVSNKRIVCKNEDTNLFRNLTYTETPFSREYGRDTRHTWIKPVGYDTGIKVYNTLSRTVEPLILENENSVKWYMCGPTVYSTAHIGHASSYMRYDILRRILTDMFDIDVVMVMGITDIDDKIINKAIRENVSVDVITKRYENEFWHDMDRLNIQPPTLVTRVTEHIPQIKVFIERLIDKGVAYEAPSGSVYFDLNKYGRYGKFLSPKPTDEVVKTEKRDERDFALWKSAKPDEPWWDSPWGNGRPGWHIECSTMASSIFGSKLDIHSGGVDLIFPHHECEICQCEAFHGCEQWGNYWMHTGFLHLKDDPNKMSKSLENVITIPELLEKYTPTQFRFFCLMSHYKSYMEYSEERMLRCIDILNQITGFLSQLDAYLKGEVDWVTIDEAPILQSLSKTQKKVKQYLRNDFRTGLVIHEIRELMHTVNIQINKTETEQETPSEAFSRSPAVIGAVKAYLDKLMSQFGIHFHEKTELLSESNRGISHKSMDVAVEFRNNLRLMALRRDEEETKLDITKTILKECDKFRDEMKPHGIIVKDHRTKSTWEVQEHVGTCTEKPLE